MTRTLMATRCAGLSGCTRKRETRRRGDQSVNLLAGECLGGGTVVNYCTSFRTPDEVRAEWASAGSSLVFRRKNTRAASMRYGARLSVNLEHNRVSARANRFCSAACNRWAGIARQCRATLSAASKAKICGYCGFGLHHRSKTVGGEKRGLPMRKTQALGFFVETRARARSGWNLAAPSAWRHAHGAANASACAVRP